MALLKIFLHKPLSGAPQKCFQSGPALAKAGPVGPPGFWCKRSRAKNVKYHKKTDNNLKHIMKQKKIKLHGAKWLSILSS